MEDCKPQYARLLTPSLLILLVTVSAILCSFGRLTSRPSETLIGVMLCAACLGALWPVIVRRTPAAGAVPGAASTGSAFLLSAGALALLFIAVSWRTGKGVYRPTDGAPAYSAAQKVLSVKKARYGSRAVAEELPDPDSKKLGAGRSLVYVPAGVTLGAGDTVHIDDTPRPITPSDIETSAYKRGLARLGIGRVYYPSADRLWLIRKGDGSMKNRLRLSLETSINAIFPADTARLLKSLYFGDKNYMDKPTLERYRLAGVMHVLAASGLHVGIIASIPLLLLAPLRVDRRIILTLGVAAAALYLYITDMPVSLMRAFIMFALYGILSVLSIGRSAINTLFLSGALILLMFPDELYGMGFQLSFGATLGILLFHRTFLTMLTGAPRFVGNAMALTLSAQTIVFPVLFLHVGEVNLAGFISNLLVVPAVSLTLVASLGTLAVSPLSGALAAAGRLITHGAATAGSAVAGLMAGAGLHFTAPPALALLLPYLCYLAPLLPFGLPARARLALLSLSLAAALAVLVHSRPSLPEHADFPVTGGHVHILARADHALVYGSIASIADARDLADHLEENGVATLQLCIPNADFKNLISFAYLVKASTVTGCVLDAGYTFSRAMTDFMEHLGRDSVRPDIRPLDRRLSDNELRGLCETLFQPPGRMPLRLKVSSPAPGFPFLSKLFSGWSGHSSAEKQALSEP